VTAHLDGELLDPSAQVVWHHLSQCWDCSSDAETLRLIKHSLRTQRQSTTATLAFRRLDRFARRLPERGEERT